MKKKEYIIPGTTVISEEPGCLMTSASANSEGIKSDSTPDTDGGDNRSRPAYDIWEDEELDEEF